MLYCLCLLIIEIFTSFNNYAYKNQILLFWSQFRILFFNFLFIDIDVTSTRYGSNIQTFFTGLSSERDQSEADKINHQRSSTPVSITQAQSNSGVTRRPSYSQEHISESNIIPSKVAVEGFIRPRAFSKEGNITPTSELSKFMTMNSQNAVGNTNLGGHQQYVQPTKARQDIKVSRHFPEIRSAIAASSDRMVTQPNMLTL